jgi:hypothetical protein
VKIYKKNNDCIDEDWFNDDEIPLSFEKIFELEGLFEG